MDGINRKNGKRVMRKASKPRSFSDTQHITISIDSDVSASSGIKQMKKKNTQYVHQTSTPRPPIKKKQRQVNTQPFFNKVGRVMRSAWFKRLVKIIIILGVLVFIINKRDTTLIILRPHLEYITLEESLTAHRTPKEDDLGFEIIAVNDEVSIPIIAGGERTVEKYAQGTVTLFNDYSSEPQRLLPETRFESASGKIFKLGKEEVIIPARIGEEASTTTAIIYADEPGSGYNIDSTDFTIPGFKEAGLDDKYNKIYAFSSNSFEGGFVGTESYITDEQREIAERDLQTQLRDRLSLKLSKEKTEELMLVDGSAQVSYRDSTSVFDDNKETGLITQRGTIFALAIGNTQLQDFITQNFLEDEDRVAMVSSHDLTISFVGNTIDFENQKNVNLSLTGEPLFSWVIDEVAFKETIRNVSKDKLPAILEATKSIDRAHIKIKPFWQKHVSDDPEKISISFE